MKIRFGTNSYRADALPISAQRCVNAYAEQQPGDARTDVAVFGCPGIVSFATCGTGPVRGTREMGGVLYVVSGGTLYSVSSTGTATAVGGTITGTGKVKMDDNGTQLIIVNGVNGYIYTVSGGFQLIVDLNFLPAYTVAYIDSFFALEHAGTNAYFLSDSLDGMSYDGLKTASAEWKSDNLVAVCNHQERLHLFGAKSTEVHQNTGSAGVPFQRNKGQGFERGIIGPHALSTDEGSIYFLSDNRVTYKLGGGLSVISHSALDRYYQTFTTISDAFSMTWSWDGHRFVAFTFPTQNLTMCFDSKTNLWHEKVSWDEFGNSLGRWRINEVCEVYGKVIVGDQFSGRLGYMSDSVYTEFDNTMPMEIVSPPLHADGGRVSMPWLQVDMETGVGLPSGQGSDPQVMLSISDDGGYSFESPELWSSFGEVGSRRTEVRWAQLGSFINQRVLKLTITDPVRRRIMGANCADLKAR